METLDSFTVQKVMKLYGVDKHKNTIIAAENKGELPKAERSSGGHRKWLLTDLPGIGEKYGFLKKLPSAKVIVVYSKKGGVFKTTLSLNLARIAALHNINTLVIGLDDQTDITNALGHSAGLSDDMSLDEAEQILASEDSLANLIDEEVSIEELIHQTDLPTLNYIPESPALDYVESMIQQRSMRDFWLRDNVIKPSKKVYDLIVIDLGPAWNQLSINALIVADLVVSPLECRINHYRNLKYFKLKMEKFKKAAGLNFQHVYVPVKVNDAKKLHKDIKKYYISNLDDCLSTGVKLSSQVEDAMALNKSVFEFSPGSPPSEEMREIMEQIWGYLQEKNDTSKSKDRKIAAKEHQA